MIDVPKSGDDSDIGRVGGLHDYAKILEEMGGWKMSEVVPKTKSNNYQY